MNLVDRIFSPQLKKFHSGKVREGFRIDDEKRMILVIDRISSFNL